MTTVFTLPQVKVSPVSLTSFSFRVSHSCLYEEKQEAQLGLFLTEGNNYSFLKSLSDLSYLYYHFYHQNSDLHYVPLDLCKSPDRFLDRFLQSPIKQLPLSDQYSQSKALVMPAFLLKNLQWNRNNCQIRYIFIYLYLYISHIFIFIHLQSPPIWDNSSVISYHS